MTLHGFGRWQRCNDRSNNVREGVLVGVHFWRMWIIEARWREREISVVMSSHGWFGVNNDRNEIIMGVYYGYFVMRNLSELSD